MNQRLRQAIVHQEFLVTAEIAPPKGANPTEMLNLAEGLKHRVHAVNITDGSRAMMRLSSLAGCVLLQQRGIEAVCQVTCRDRNRIGLQADLLGAHALGIANILALTGDPVKVGDHPKAKAVYDLESVRLLRLIQRLNQGKDANDTPLPDGGTHFLAGAAVDPQLPSWSSLQMRFERKIRAGAEFFQSQLISDFDRFGEFMERIAKPHGKPILAGIFLLKSAKNAAFINRMVPGVHIPQTTIDRLAAAPDPLQEGITIAAEQIKTARALCQGVHVMAVKREDLIPQILDRAGLAPVTSPTSSNVP